MSTSDIVLGIILIVAAVFLIVAVLMQHGKQKNLSGTIAGGAETFFGKTKGRAIDKVLSKLTTIVSVFFLVVVITVYVLLPDPLYDIAAPAAVPFSGSPYYTMAATDKVDDTADESADDVADDTAVTDAATDAAADTSSDTVAAGTETSADTVAADADTSAGTSADTTAQ